MSTSADDLVQLMKDLADETEAIPFSKLYDLSDLSGQRLDTFRDGWSRFSAGQRARVVRALVDLADASFEVNFDAIFRHCLEDPDSEVRAAAVDGLWESGSVNLIGPFLNMLRSDPSPEVRSAAASGLGRYVLAGELEQQEAAVSSRIVMELLTVIHLSGESARVRRRAVESVAYTCSGDVQEALELAYYDDDEEMRLSALVGMGRSCDRRWEPIVLDEMKSSSPAMRYEAALASGGLALRSAVPILSRMVEDADREASNAAVWALGQIGGEEAKVALLNALDQEDQDTQAAVNDALAELTLSEGQLDFALYDLDDDSVDDLDIDVLLPLWEAGDEDGEEPGEEW